MNSKHRSVVDLDTLEPETRRLVEKAIGRRDTPFALRLRKSDIDRWRAAAEAAGETITDWVERNLNRAAAKAKGAP